MMPNAARVPRTQCAVFTFDPVGGSWGWGKRREEVLDVVGGERAGEHEALAAVALLVLQLAELLVLLDALGQRLQAELLAELHERVQERLRLDRVG